MMMFDDKLGVDKKQLHMFQDGMKNYILQNCGQLSEFQFGSVQAPRDST